MSETEIHISQILPGTANQLIGSNAAATKNEYKTLSGTSNQITVTNGAGTITLSTPQSIATTSSPTFANITDTGITANTLVYSNGSQQLTAVTLGSGLTLSSGTLSASGTSYSAGTGLTLTSTTFSLTAPVTIALGGTNSTTALVNNYLMQSSGGKIVESAVTIAGSTITGTFSGTATTAQNLSGTSVGSVPYQSGSSITSYLTLGSAYQLLGVNSGATAPVYLTLAGTTNQVTLTSSGTTTTFSLPQSIATSSSPSFNSLTITGTSGLVLSGTNVGISNSGAFAISSSSQLTLSGAPYVAINSNFAILGHNNIQLTDSSTHSISISAPSSVSSSYSLALPTAQGSAGQTISNDGSGNLSWVSQVTPFREDYVVGTALNNYTGSTTVFNLVNSYSVGGHTLIVTLDGDVQTVGATVDYVETNTTTVTFNNALIVGQKVSFIFSQPAGATSGVVNSSVTSHHLAYYATSGSTVSSSQITDDGSGNLGAISSFTSNGSNPATAGVIRLANDESISWRNAANTGNVSITVDTGNNLNVGSAKITALANGTASTDAMAFGQNHVFQVVSATSTSSATTTSSTYTSTNLTASITPTSSSSKILVIASGTLGMNPGSDAASISIFRGSTNLGDSTFGLQTYSPTTGGATTSPCTMSFLDSPATTSATTYTVKISATSSAGTVSFGLSASVQSIILVEVQ